MSALLAVLALVGVAAIGAIVVDLLADVPRLALWMARSADGLLPERDRSFFGMAAEVEVAASEAAEGRRSRLSVVAMAIGMIVAALRQRVRRRALPRSLGHLPHGNWVKIAWPVDLDDMPVFAEWVWAERVSADRYRIDNHPLLSDVTCADDIIRAAQLEDHAPGWLEFKEVVAPAANPEIQLWIRWPVLVKRRRHRLGRKLAALGGTSAWLSPRLGKASVPAGSPTVADEVGRLLRRAQVEWDAVDRVKSPLG